MTKEDGLVSHPADGVYLSKFMAGILATVASMALVAGFTNLWHLNRKSIEFEQHILQANSSTYALPGALTRREFELEKQTLGAQLSAINDKLDSLSEKIDGQ